MTAVTLLPESRDPIQMEPWKAQTYRCRTCHDPVNRYMRYDHDASGERTGEGEVVDWLHARVFTTYDHDADPVELPLAEGVCDFCLSPGPRWQFYGADLNVMAIDVDEGLLLPGHTGDTYGARWSACDPCDAMIAVGDLDGLVRRVVRLSPALAEGITTPRRAGIYARTLIGRYLPTIYRREMIPGQPPVRLDDIPPSKLPKVRDRLAALWRDGGARYVHSFTSERPVAFPAADLDPDLDPAQLDVNAHLYAEDIPDEAAARFCQRLDIGLRVGELYWISPEFTGLAVKAGQKLDNLSITQEELPASSGLLLWQQPVTRVEGARHEGDIVAASWCRVPDGIWMNFYLRADQTMNRTDIQALREKVGWLVPGSLGGGAGFGLHGRDNGKASALVATLLATWFLIRQPGVATVTHEPAEKATRKAYARAGRPAPTVRVVDLRHRARSGQDDVEAAGRVGSKWSYRVLVGAAEGGFWRDYWIGPSHPNYPAGATTARVRDKRWIMPYLTGTDDMPLKDEHAPPVVKTLR